MCDPFGNEEPGVPAELDVQVPRGLVRPEGNAGGHSSVEYEPGMTLRVEGETVSEQSHSEAERSKFVES